MSAAAPYVDEALRQAHVAYTARNPASRKAHHDAHDALPGGNTRTVIHAEPFPLTWVEGRASRLTSIDGHVYTDLLGDFSAGIFGHSCPTIAKAVQQGLAAGWNFGGNSLLEKQFAKVVCDRFRASGIDLVRFTNSGTEANTTALGAAVAITGRTKILVFSGGYHGSTLVFPMTLMHGTTSAPMNLPHEFVFAPYNNISETKGILARVGAQNIAAVLLEPIQGSGGCRPATREFLQYVRHVCTDSGAIMVIDEVMSSRLGHSGCSATHGIKGDLVTLGKYVGGGMTFGAFGGRRDIMEHFDPAKNLLFHPGTYNNNVVTMSAGLAGLSLYDSAAVDRLNGLGEDLKRQIQQILLSAHIYPSGLSCDSKIIETDSLERDNSLSVSVAGQKLDSLPAMFVTGSGSMLNLSRNINIATRGYTPLNLALTSQDVGKYVEAIREFVHIHGAHLRVPQSTDGNENKIALDMRVTPQLHTVSASA